MLGICKMIILIQNTLALLSKEVIDDLLNKNKIKLSKKGFIYTIVE